MKRLPLALLAALLAACSTWRWSGNPPNGVGASALPRPGESKQNHLHPPPVVKSEAPPIAVSEKPARKAAEPLLPETPPERYKAALFYSDLGPESLDTSGFTTQHRYDYELFAKACSRCHTLARALYSPHAGRLWWEFYLANMRVRTGLSASPVTREEARAVLDFMEEDGRTRKKTRRFQDQIQELRRRFEEHVSARLQELQRSSPPSIRP